MASLVLGLTRPCEVCLAPSLCAAQCSFVLASAPCYTVTLRSFSRMMEVESDNNDLATKPVSRWTPEATAPCALRLPHTCLSEQYIQ
ncbi:hypothetical protein BDV09DRAFT_160154 [Aspergillus tetrazonus]